MFGRNKSRADGLQHWCKACRNEHHKSKLARVPRRNWLYVIAVGGFVKIGRAERIKERMKDYATHNPEPAELLVAVPQAGDFEHQIHRKWDMHRTRGEWFKPACELMQWVEKLAAAEDKLALIRATI